LSGPIQFSVFLALSSLQNSTPLLTFPWSGFTCGTLDISAALVVYRYFGRPPMRLLQGIAASVLGSRSFQGGLPTALLGLFVGQSEPIQKRDSRKFPPRRHSPALRFSQEDF
jgi:hypothetical protein